MRKIALLMLAFCSAGNAAEVPFVSGGVGLENREEMRALASGYNLHMIFSTAEGAYVADVAVEIKDADGGTVLRAVSDGPWLYAKLPPGTYTVAVEQGGSTITKRIAVNAGKPSTLHFRWT